VSIKLKQTIQFRKANNQNYPICALIYANNYHQVGV